MTGVSGRTEPTRSHSRRVDLRSWSRFSAQVVGTSVASYPEHRTDHQYHDDDHRRNGISDIVFFYIFPDLVVAAHWHTPQALWVRWRGAILASDLPTVAVTYALYLGN